MSQPARNVRPQPLEANVERLAWPDFFDRFAAVYRQHEHVSILGPTQTGKTTLARELLELRECVIVLAVKPEDPTAEKFRDYGYRIQESLQVPTVEDAGGRKVPHPSYRRIIVWPRSERDESGGWRSIAQMTMYQRREVRRVLDYVRRSRRWTIFTDDVNTITDRETPAFNMGADLKWFWRNGSSAKMGVMSAGQRPSWIPREAYSSPNHLFFFSTRDGGDLERLSDIGAGIDTRQLEHVIANLRRHEFLYLAPREHPPTMIVSRVEL